jgi:NH3-dependent NAD+ synthetase
LPNGLGCARLDHSGTKAYVGTQMTPADFQLSQPLSARRIVVAMSGGVDSSVVAALAAQSGAEDRRHAPAV